MTSHQLLTVEEAAAEFGIHRSTLFRAIKDERLARHRRMGARQTYLDRWEVARLVDPPAISRCLQLIYREFSTNGAWPTAVALQRRLDREGVEFDLLSALETLPAELGWRVRDQEGHAQLTLRGIARCENSADDVSAFLVLVRTCYTRYLSDDEKPEVTSAQLAEDFGFDRLTLEKLYKIVQIESGFWSGLGHMAEGWTLAVDVDRVRHFRGVDTLSAYLEAKQRAFQPATVLRRPPTDLRWHLLSTSPNKLYPPSSKTANEMHPAITNAVNGLPTDDQGSAAVMAAASAFEHLLAERIGVRRYGKRLVDAYFDLVQQAAPPDPRRVEALRSVAIGAMAAFRNPVAHGGLTFSGAHAREVVTLFSLLARELEPLSTAEVDDPVAETRPHATPKRRADKILPRAET
jgi:predicted DNA-binding transcriptional regulator AlpA